MKIKYLLSMGLVASMLLGSEMITYAADATVLQGDTSNSGDVEKFEDFLIENAIKEEYSVMCAEIKSDGTDEEGKIISKRITYKNQFLGIALDGNMISVGVDNEGVYDVINTWNDVKPAENTTYYEVNGYSYDDVILSMEKYCSEKGIELGMIEKSELKYAQSTDGGYELSYLLKYNNGVQANVSLVNLEIIEIYE